MIFLTGTTGFIGSHILNNLLTYSNSESLAILHRQPPEKSNLRGFPGQNLKQILAKYPSIRCIYGSLRDIDKLNIGATGTRTIIHAASKNIDFDGTGFDDNLVGIKNLCNAAIQNKVKKFIYISSVGVYGHGEYKGNDETLAVQPDSALSRSKAQCEQIILEHHNQGDFQAIILRPRFIYGTGDFYVMPRLIKAIFIDPICESRIMREFTKGIAESSFRNAFMRFD